MFYFAASPVLEIHSFILQIYYCCSILLNDSEFKWRFKSTRNGRFVKTLLPKELISKPPIFEVGSDIENHVKKMEIFFKAVNITDSDTMKAILLTTLSDATNAELFSQADYSDCLLYTSPSPRD